MTEMTKEIKSKDMTITADIAGILNGPIFTAALETVPPQLKSTVIIALYAGTTIIISWTIKRVVCDVVDIFLKGVEVKNALEKK